MKKVLGIGNALVDVLVQVESELILNELQLPKGSMQLINTERYLKIQKRLESLNKQLTTGGSACNTILAIANLGGQPGLIGKVGHDEMATFFADNCVRHDIKANLLHAEQLPTGVASTFITPDGQRTFGTHLGAAATLTADDIKAEWFEGYDYFYIEGYLVQNHALIRRAVDLAHRAGLQVCIDLASFNIVEEDREFFKELLQKRTSCLPTNSRRRLSRVARMRSTMWKHWLNSATLRWLKLARRAFLCAVATNRFTVRHARCLWWSTPQQRATISRQAFYLPFLRAAA